MKLIFLLLLLPSLSYSQGTYVGLTVGTKNEYYIRSSYENNGDWIQQEYSLLLGNKAVFIQAKMGFGFMGKRFKGYVYMPFLNYNVFEHKYNTPAGVEIFYRMDIDKNKRRKTIFSSSINFDIYTDYIIPSLRLNVGFAKVKKNKFKHTYH